MRRRTLTIGCLLFGLALMVVSYFLFTAPWGATGVDNSNPRVGFASLLTVLGVMLAFSSALVYELLPDHRTDAERAKGSVGRT